MRRVPMISLMRVGSFVAVLLMVASVEVVAPPPIKEITINVGAFFFEGPEGKSSSKDNPVVVATLKNGEKVKLIFQNVSTIDHEIISPLFAAPMEKVRDLKRGGKVIIVITPKFRSVEDGAVFEFDLACHENHGTSNDHFLKGMRAVIRVQNY